jgi:flagellar assembly protein FliH
MSSEILRGDRAAEVQQMPWLVVGPELAQPAAVYPEAPGTKPQPAPKPEPEPQPDFEARLAAMQAEMAAMRADKERAVREAHEAGRLEAENAARQAAKAGVGKAMEEIGSTVRGLAELRPRLRLMAEADLVRLALDIARRVVRRELSTDPEAILGLVRTALERLRLQEAVRVRLHPEYRDAVLQFLARTPGAAHIDVVADPTLDRGAVHFETVRGSLDASSDTQFKEIERGLTDRLKSYGL